MSIIATALKHLIAAGVSGDDLVRAVAEMEAEMTPVAVVTADPVAEKRRAYDRERKRAKKNNSTGIPPESAESAEKVSPKEYISNPHPKPQIAKAIPSPLTEIGTRVVEAWNQITAGTPLPQSRTLTKDRLKLLRCRLDENSEADVIAAIRAMAASDWHSGKSGNWTSGHLGWLLKAENFTKMLERAPSAEQSNAAAEWTAERRAAYAAELASRETGQDHHDEPRTDKPPGYARSIGELSQTMLAGRAH